jgi:hypothetical protein
MRRSGAAFIVLAAVLGLGFIAGMVHLFRARMDTGDMYPPYSTFRADPLGSKALYDTLGATAGCAVARSYVPRDRLHVRNAAILFLGLDPGVIQFGSGKSLDEYEALAKQGNRVILTLLPVASKSVEVAPESPASKRWGVSVGYRKVRSRPAGSGAVPRETALFLRDLSPEWHVVAGGDSPRVIERRFDSGAVVLSIDTYPFSNESLVTSPQPDLIANLLGPSRLAVFDEFHHNMVENGSIGALARRYRLHGIVLVLLLMAVLYIWKSGTSLLPEAASAESDVVSGKDTASGLASLLRRTVPSRALAETCVSMWKKSAGDLSRMPAIEDILRTEKDPVRTYERIRQILAERQTHS